MDSSLYFLEAHYYSGGLRHYAYHLGPARPPWAPRSDTVGFFDEFPLEGEDAAVEIKRVELDGNRLTWIAVYYRSVDQKLGDRRNHAGVGVWLKDLVPTSVQELLYGLDQLARFIAREINPEALDEHARVFLSDQFLPTYVKPLSAFGDLEGLPFSTSTLTDTNLYHLHCRAGVSDCRALADHILGQLLLGAKEIPASRSLFLVTDRDPATDGLERLHALSEGSDTAARFANALPELLSGLIADNDAVGKALAETRAQLEQARIGLEEMTARNAELQRFKADPIHSVLTRVNEIGNEVRAMSAKLDSGRAPSISAFPPRPASRPVRRPYAADELSSGKSDWVTTLALVLLLVALPILLILVARAVLE